MGKLRQREILKKKRERSAQRARERSADRDSNQNSALDQAYFEIISNLLSFKNCA